MLFLVVFVRLGYSLALVPALVFTGLLIVGSFTDLDHFIIPDRITMGGLAAALVMAAIPPLAHAPGNPLNTVWFPQVSARFEPLVEALVAAVLAAGFLWLVGLLGSIVFRKEAMGLGDVKLFAMLGAFCGLDNLLVILLVASVMGTVVGLAGILAGRLRSSTVEEATAPLRLHHPEISGLLARYPLAQEEAAALEKVLNSSKSSVRQRHYLPFGPSLAVAAYIAYLWGPSLRAAFNRAMLHVNDVIWGPSLSW